MHFDTPYPCFCLIPEQPVIICSYYPSMVFFTFVQIDECKFFLLYFLSSRFSLKYDVIFRAQNSMQCNSLSRKQLMQFLLTIRRIYVSWELASSIYNWPKMISWILITDVSRTELKRFIRYALQNASLCLWLTNS